jgi:hypothetical protein
MRTKDQHNIDKANVLLKMHFSGEFPACFYDWHPFSWLPWLCPLCLSEGIIWRFSHDSGKIEPFEIFHRYRTSQKLLTAVKEMIDGRQILEFENDS